MTPAWIVIVGVLISSTPAPNNRQICLYESPEGRFTISWPATIPCKLEFSVKGPLPS
jgi:hypothetical protein